jgi:hypothetical protein
VPSTLSPDASERVLPGARYTPRCLQRIADDRAGFTLLTPLLLAGQDSTVYARDLHERDTLLLAEHPQREVWLLRPTDSAAGSIPKFERVSRDSIIAAARRAGKLADARIQNRVKGEDGRLSEYRVQNTDNNGESGSRPASRRF